MSDQPHALAALSSGKVSLVPTGLNDWWTSDLVMIARNQTQIRRKPNKKLSQIMKNDEYLFFSFAFEGP
jgi:hypothetical protein